MKKLALILITVIMSSMAVLSAYSQLTLLRGALPSLSEQSAKLRLYKELGLDEQRGVGFKKLYSEDHWQGGGCRLYEIELIDGAESVFAEWEALPLSQEAREYVEMLVSCDQAFDILNDVNEGRWRYVDRNPNENYFAEIMLCIYDAENDTAYYVDNIGIRPRIIAAKNSQRSERQL